MSDDSHQGRRLGHTHPGNGPVPGCPGCTGGWLSRDAAYDELLRLGYTVTTAAAAVMQAGRTGRMQALHDHVVSYGGDVNGGEGGYLIEPKAAAAARDGHAPARKQIAGHGRDRYPAVAVQYAKVLDEAGELGEALMNLYLAAGRYHEHPRDGSRCFADEQEQRVRDEYAGLGLAYFELGSKLGLDAIAEMARLAAADDRDFREGS